MGILIRKKNMINIRGTTTTPLLVAGLSRFKHPLELADHLKQLIIIGNSLCKPNHRAGVLERLPIAVGAI